MRYTREVPLRADQDAIRRTEAHVRAHLSAVTTEDDDPDARADEVQVEYEAVGDVLRIIGDLDGSPVAPYLEES